MYCKFHSNNPAKYICAKCTAPICDECALDFDGKKYCNECVKNGLNSSSQKANPYQNRYVEEGLLKNMIFFAFACVPGAGAMSLGYMERGLYLICAFMASIALISFGLGELMLVLIVPIWLFSFFDSYNLRKGKYVSMGAYDLDILKLSGFFRSLNISRRTVGVVIVFIGIIALFRIFDFRYLLESIGIVSESFIDVWANIENAAMRSIVPICLIIFGTKLFGANRRDSGHKE